MEHLKKIQQQHKLIHGGDIYSAREMLGQGAETQKGSNALLDFSANLNPLGLPEGVKEAIAAGMEDYAAYPDPLCRDLISALSAVEGLPADWLFCGNGAADIIFRLVYGVKPQKALVLAPTFAEYEEALQQVGCQVYRYELKEELGFQLDQEFLQALDGDLDMVFLCNPNNPTGQLLPREGVLEILQRCKELNILLVVDECFNGFLDEEENYSAKGYLADFDNLIILKALTKTYAMAGLRLGYCMTANTALRSKIAAAGPPWSVSIVAQVAGIQALKEKDYMQETKVLLRKERTYLSEALEGLGAMPISSGANYLFFRWPFEKEVSLAESLFGGGILIRNCDNYHGLQAGYYRICIKRHEDNKRLIEAIGDIVREIRAMGK